MRIALGNDHAGYPLKEYVRTVLEDLGHEVIDRGAPSETPVDFPDIAFDTCDAVRKGEADREFYQLWRRLGPVHKRLPVLVKYRQLY